MSSQAASARSSRSVNVNGRFFMWSNEVVEKPLQDIAPVMHMLQDFDIEIFRSEMRDGPL
jgi:hypothetical protein